MAEHPIQGMMDTTLQKIREMVDASTVIGEPINSGSSVIIPVSRISYGFASGGSDLPNKQQSECFGGAGGAGVSVTPVAFIVIANGDVKLLQLDAGRNTADKALDLIPELIDKVREGFSKKEPSEK